MYRMIFLLIGMTFASQQKGVDFPSILSLKVAVIPIDYPDNRTKVGFPSVSKLDSILFDSESHVQRWYKDQSYGKFKFSGKVFNPIMSPRGLDQIGDGEDQISGSIYFDLKIPELDTALFDYIAFVPMSDSILLGARAGLFKYILNGDTIQKNALYCPLFGGYWNRKGNELSGTLTDSLSYAIQTGNSWSSADFEEGNVPNGMRNWERIWIHEMGHLMGVGGHSNSKTNNQLHWWEQSANTDVRLANYEYGNQFDIMGYSQWGLSASAGIKDMFGWDDDLNRIILDQYGTQRVTIFPLNSGVGVRSVEIRIPGLYNDWDRKNFGYYLEYRSKSYWDTVLANPKLLENTKGIMVQTAADGFISSIIDVSPSPNFSVNGVELPDIRDIVLKPGMTYQTPHIRLSQVAYNANGSISVDVEILNTNVVIRKMVQDSRNKQSDVKHDVLGRLIGNEFVNSNEIYISNRSRLMGARPSDSTGD